MLEQSTSGLILKETWTLHNPGSLAARLIGSAVDPGPTLFMHLQVLSRSALVHSALRIDLIPLQHSDGTLNPSPYNT